VDINFKNNVRNSFSKAKEDVELLKHELKLQKEILISQNEAIKSLHSKLNEILSKLSQINSNFSNKSSERSQSDHRAITERSHSKKLDKIEFKDISIGNEGVDQASDQIRIEESSSETRQNLTKTQEEAFKSVGNYLETTFKQLSKQELKTFLTIYQLEDEGKLVSHESIALLMDLSEHRIRAHISALIKKGAPLIKKKINNRSVILSIKKEFKLLNLKKQLVLMYYEKDPYQTTLFDVE